MTYHTVLFYARDFKQQPVSLPRTPIMFMQDSHISCLLSCTALPFALLLCVLLDCPLERLRMASN